MNLIATAIDMSGIVSGVVDQVTESWESVVPIVAMILGLSIGAKLIRKWAK